MKRFTLLLIGILCLLLTGKGYAQQSNYLPTLPDVVPASPTSRIFQKFTGYPVSHATGTIDVQIPLYTLQQQGLSMPFTLKYHSSGVKVQDPVGIVGRNWALFPGLKISRTVHGKPDEIYPVTDKGSSPSIPDQIRLSSPYRDMECRVQGQIDQDRMDGQYDLFQLNMPGMNASFVLQTVNGSYRIQPLNETPLLITPMQDSNTNYLSDHLYGFEVKDDKGIRYLFGENAPLRGSSPAYLEFYPYSDIRCGWMLREVIFPSGDKMTLTYKSITEPVPTFNSSITVLDYGEHVGLPGCFHDDMIDTATGSNSAYWRFLGTAGYMVSEGNGPPFYSNNTSLVPLTLSAPNVEMAFAYSNLGMLQSLTVKQKGGTLIKEATFAYDSGATGKLLKSVSLSGEGSYALDYKNEGIVSRAGFDWWGYYNGTVTNNTGLPSTSLNVFATNGGVGYNMSVNIGHGADRTPVAAYMDTHSLTKVTFPTKGTLTIGYEPNSFVVKGTSRIGEGIRVKQTSLYDPTSGKTVVKHYTYEEPHYSETDYPDVKSLFTTGYLCTMDDGTARIRQRTLSVFSPYANLSGSHARLWYGKVTETTDEWKKEYCYDYTPDEYHNTAIDRFYPDYNLNYEYLLSQYNRAVFPAPWLTAETSYMKTGSSYQKVSRVEHTYRSFTRQLTAAQFIPYQYPYGENSIGAFMDPAAPCNSNKYYSFYGTPVRMSSYRLAYGWHNRTSTRSVEYCGTDSLVQMVSYSYDTERPYNLTKRTTLDSDGTLWTDSICYSNNTVSGRTTLTLAQQNAITALTSANLLTTPVQRMQFKGNLLVGGELFGFSNLLSTLPVMESVYQQDAAGAYSERIAYRKYDNYGNPIHAIKDGTEKVVWLWCHKGECLVARIQNATYDQVKTAIGMNPETLSRESELPIGMTFKLTGLSTSLPNVLTEVFTHSPGIGVIQETALNGYNINYTYDSFARLSQKSDGSGTVEQYNYHYK